MKQLVLSKSDYMLFLKHPAWLWLKKFDKNRLPPVDENTQAMFDVGHDFENYAEQLFTNTIKLGFDNYNDYLSLPERTNQALKNGAEVIFQGRFEVDNLTCIIDVLQKNPDNSFDLIEIKSSSRAKPEHEYDLAFQLLVLEKSGIKIRNIAVMHANKKYVRDGEIDPKQLVAKTDITDKVRSLMSTTLLQIDMAFEVLAKDTMPDISPRYINQLNIPDKTSPWLEEWMKIFRSFKENLNRYSFYNLAYPSPEQLGKLEDLGIKTIHEMTEDQALREKQVVQIKTTKTNKRIIDKDKIELFINNFKYPLYFFDYETLSTLIPQFDGYGPYKDYPFQYSLHVIEAPGSEVKHFEYLHNKASDPMPALLKQLKNDIGENGTVLTWNKSYEIGCNNRMGELYPDHAEFLSHLNERIEDLMKPFSEMWYFHKDFFGSASVKKVMPVLAPELSYKELNVGDGLLARRMWTQTALQGQHQVERNKIMEDLSKYCTLDTYAMVRIYEELQKVVK
jgi:hypothetical protein